MLLLTVIAIVAFGLLMVYSASFIYAQERTGDGFTYIKKQVLFAGIGFGFLFLTSRINYRKWADWGYVVLGIATFLLVLVMIPGLGIKAGGAQRWIKLGFLSFQPGELAKFAIIFFVARQLERKSDRLDSIVAGMLSHFLVPLPALLLLLAQPDFGTTVMIALSIFALLHLAGVPRKYLLTSLLLIAIAASWLALGSSYRRARLLTFLDPWQDPAGKGFQIIQSFIGLYNGNFWGVGLGNGKEKLFYLPEAHNDFIMAVIGEELGFLGVLGVVAAYVFFIHRGFKIGWNCYKQHRDKFAMLLACGITLALGFQALLNIAVVLGLVPTKGLNLPFISYGGSSLLVDLFAVGVLLSVGRGPVNYQQKKLEKHQV